MDSIRFEILEEFGKLSESKFAFELNLVRWNGNDGKYDIRKWSEDGKIAYKGISLSKTEFVRFIDMLKMALTKEKNSLCIYEGNEGKVKYKIIADYGVVSETERMSKRLTYTDWGYGAKYDLRSWTEDYSRCGKGIALKEDEAKNLLEISEKIEDIKKYKNNNSNVENISVDDLDEDLLI